MPSDSDRLTALEIEHRNLKDAIAKEFVSERTITTYSISAVEARVTILEEDMAAYSIVTEGIKENLQILADAERDRKTRENTQKEEAEKTEKAKEKTFFAKFMDEFPRHLATLVAGGVFAVLLFLAANASKIGVTN